MIREDFLHYLWRLKRFDLSNLYTTTGESIQILNVGEHNHDSGPDFFNAQIKIGSTVWAGNVEIHVNASEWIKHQHFKDPAYENVILHVVLEEDQAIYHSNGERIPCLELKKRVPAKLSTQYYKLLHNECWIPCQNHLFKIPEITTHFAVLQTTA